MSRGLGRTQRVVLDALGEQQDREPEWRWMSVREIVHREQCASGLEWDGDYRGGEWRCETCGAPEPSAAVVESVRRAIRTLSKSHLVETGHFTNPSGRKISGTAYEWEHDGERGHYAGTDSMRKQLYARLTLTTEERQAEDERREARMQRLGERLAGRLGTD